VRPKNKVVCAQEAIAHIESGMSIAVGGFLSQGDPLTLIRALNRVLNTPLEILAGIARQPDGPARAGAVGRLVRAAQPDYLDKSMSDR
jgi:acyl CoA:acetate/3-ketoacid CoA transferase alpha subunit